MGKVTVSRMRKRYAQTVLTFRITLVYLAERGRRTAFTGMLPPTHLQIRGSIQEDGELLQ
jgi:hypothetical protein